MRPLMEAGPMARKASGRTSMESASADGAWAEAAAGIADAPRAIEASVRTVERKDRRGMAEEDGEARRTERLKSMEITPRNHHALYSLVPPAAIPHSRATPAPLASRCAGDALRFRSLGRP